MMRFLKSILFGDKETLHKTDELRKVLTLLSVRVTLLEDEQKRSLEAIEGLTGCLKSFSGIITDLAADMNAVSLWMQTQAVKELKEINERRRRKDPLSLSFDDLSDDDDDNIVN